MGCGTSKDVMKKINDQQKKIDNLIHMNEQLQSKILELHHQTINSGLKSNNDTGTDLTHLKSTIDSRLNKIEKTIDKIHNELRIKVSDGQVKVNPIATYNNNFNNANDAVIEHSLSLDFGKDIIAQERKPCNLQWNDLLQDSENTVKLMSPIRVFSNEEMEKDGEDKKADQQTKEVKRSKIFNNLNNDNAIGQKDKPIIKVKNNEKENDNQLNSPKKKIIDYTDNSEMKKTLNAEDIKIKLEDDVIKSNSSMNMA